MENIILHLSNSLSCFIVVWILFQFMNERYKKMFQSKYIYIMIEVLIIVGVSFVNLLRISLLNLAVWVISVALCSGILYFEEMDKPIKRILESEVLILCMTVAEGLGSLVIDFLLQQFDINIQNDSMKMCLEITFSKLIIIFIYYVIVERLMKKRAIPVSKKLYLIYFIIFMYSIVNMVVIVELIEKDETSLFLTINMGCIVLADLYLLYFVKVMNNKNYLECELKSMEKQADMQYKYYVQQEQKYHRTVQILHDLNKHIKSIQYLYANGDIQNGTMYITQIEDMLKPLIPKKYTGNPILDILLTEKESEIFNEGISFDIKVNNVNLDFIEAIDVTTIFGNLLDNSIEACRKVATNKRIFVKINSYYEMVSIRIENTSNELKWREGIPVSKKGENHGMGLLNVKRSVEKYDGDMKLQYDNGIFVVDIFLNS